MKHSRDLRSDWEALRPEQQAALAARTEWLDTARPEQVEPFGDWLTWLILAGRGWGKTRTGAQSVAWAGMANPGWRIAVVAPTSADVRDTCVEGESGLLRCLPDVMVQTWNRSLGELVLVNGSRYKLFSADEPERLRGPQHHMAWADEVAAWRYPEAWDQLMFGLRLGKRPRVVATTTPKPSPLIKSLLAAPGTTVTRGSTFDNAANLSAPALQRLREKYEGTRLGRQELHAEVLSDLPGALWTQATLDTYRMRTRPAMGRIVVAVDPAVTNTEDSDEHGIIVAGLTDDRRGAVLEDGSLRGTPRDWARRAVSLYRKHAADGIVVEVNQGGDMVAHTLRAEDPNVNIIEVRASRGKHVRAEPVSSLYEQGRAFHVGLFPELELQMTQMTTEGYRGEGSPDRVDALVWAMSALFPDMVERGFDLSALVMPRAAGGWMRG